MAIIQDPVAGKEFVSRTPCIFLPDLERLVKPFPARTRIRAGGSPRGMFRVRSRKMEAT